MTSISASEQISRLVVVGGGVTGLTVSCMLAARSGKNVEVILIESLEKQDVTLATETTMPSINGFFSLMGIEPKTLIDNGCASFKLATRYKGWAGPDHDYFLPYGKHGFDLNNKPFSAYASLARLKGDRTRYDDYSLAALCAKAGRYDPGAQKRNQVYATIVPALQLSAEKYAEYLESHAKSLGVTLIREEPTKAVVDADSGNILSVETTSGRLLDGDLFFDCSGEEGFLIDRHLGVPYDSASDFCPVNRLARVSVANQTQRLYSEVCPIRSGWIVQADGPTASSYALSYNSELTSDSRAAEELEQFLQKPGDEKVLFSDLKSGSRRQAWYKNCIAVGQSASYLESFVCGQLNWSQMAIVRVLQNLPSTKDYKNIQEEYNRLTQQEFTRRLDFHILHYHLMGSSDLSDFWKLCNGAPSTDELDRRLDLFKIKGDIAFFEGEAYPEELWVSLLLGHGVWPESYDAVLDALDSTWITLQLEKMRKIFSDAARSMPSK